MGWSTREIAELADTTVNTVRHYHRLGLLDEPERSSNGYKQYGVHELVRLLQIRRLVALGVPLSQIETTGPGLRDSRALLQELDDELVAGIARLQRARADIAVILREGSPADVRAGFEAVAAHLSEADSSILHIAGQLYDDAAMADLHQMVQDDVAAGELGKVIDALPAEADAATRERLAELLAPILVQNITAYPWLVDPAAHLTRSEQITRETFTAAVVELYNPAQLDVIARAVHIAQQIMHPEEAPQRSD